MLNSETQRTTQFDFMFYSHRKKRILEGLLGYILCYPNNADDFVSAKTSPPFPNFNAIWIVILPSRTRGSMCWFSLSQLFAQVSKIYRGRKIS